MSNVVVPQIYKNIIQDVIGNVAVDFEEYGLDESVLSALQKNWEEKLLETKVANFARDPHADDDTDSASEAGENQAPTSRRPTDNGSYPYGHQAVDGQSYYSPNQYADNQRQYAGGLALPQTGYGDARVKHEPEELIRPRGGASNETKPKVEPNAAGLLPGDEVIDSDLDDSEGDLDDDIDGGDETNVDYVFCVYDKVQRVKNKWKTVFKDGMLHINGKDYLFQKCNGEFEW